MFKCGEERSVTCDCIHEVLINIEGRKMVVSRNQPQPLEVSFYWGLSHDVTKIQATK